MSDTLPEREDQMNDKRETAIQLILSEVQQGYTIDEAVKRIINRHCGQEDQMATTATTNTHHNPTVWHDCCKGYDHAPWCTGYEEYDMDKERVKFQDELAQTMTSMGAKEITLPATTHQPAARGGGDGWRLEHLATNARGTKTLLYGDVPVAIVGTETLNDHQRALDMTVALNQHHSLVAERERLLELLRQVTSATKCYCVTLESSKCWQCQAREAIEQRSTSE